MSSDIQPTITNKPRAGRQLCLLLFCEERGCTKTFESLAELEEHKFLDIHSIPKMTSFHSVKQAFGICMLSSNMNHSSLCSSPAISLSSTSSGGVLIERSIFSLNGGTLRVCTSFRFKKKQKNFLFKAFADGKHSGKKASPKVVHQNMRTFFNPVDYCSAHQIKSLFSRGSQDFRSSTLPDLAEKITSKGNFCLFDKLLRNDNTSFHLISERIIQQVLLMLLVRNSIVAIETQFFNNSSICSTISHDQLFLSL